MAKYRFMKPCGKCGVLTVDSLCPKHKALANELEVLRQTARKRERIHYSKDYPRLAKIVRDGAMYCHLCGEGARFGDPFEADHLFPGTIVTDITQLAPAHRSCNIARGNKPLT